MSERNPNLSHQEDFNRQEEEKVTKVILTVQQTRQHDVKEMDITRNLKSLDDVAKRYREGLPHLSHIEIYGPRNKLIFKSRTVGTEERITPEELTTEEWFRLYREAPAELYDFSKKEVAPSKQTWQRNPALELVVERANTAGFESMVTDHGVAVCIPSDEKWEYWEYVSGPLGQSWIPIPKETFDYSKSKAR